MGGKGAAVMPDRLNVELARVGTFDLQEGGRQTFTPGMLRSAAAKQGGRIPVKLGHLAAALNDGAPAFGWVGNLRVAGDGDDTRLLGDITDIPTWLDESADWAYPHRSIEGNVRAAGDDRDLTVTGLALLGATPPGMPTLTSWRDLPKALAAAAAAGSTDLTVTEFRAAFEALAPLADSPASQTPASPPVAPSTNPEGADHMSDTLTTGLREKLGITDADLDEAGLLAALGEALAENAEPAPPTPAAIAAAYGITTDEVETRLKAAAAPVVPDGKVIIDAAQWEDVKVAAALGAEARRTQLVQDRDTAIQQAFQTGRISAAAKPAWQKRWDVDPDTTRTDLASLEVVFPISAAAGHGGSNPTDDTDAAYEGLYGKES